MDAMRRKIRPGPLAALLVLGTLCALTGCRNPEGESCATPRDCGEGFTCVEQPAPVGGLRRPICMKVCESRADCPSPQLCVEQPAVLTRTCLFEGGTIPTGDSCDLRYFECRVGDACTPNRDGTICVPGCNPQTLHSIDRICPAGRLCDLEAGQSPAPCLEVCDPGDPAACDRTLGRLCIRTDYPGVGVVGLCLTSGYYSSCQDPVLHCDDAVCVDHTCVDPVDAPPIPFRPINPMPLID